MDDFKPPVRLSFEGDVAQAWKEWKQMFELYLMAKEATEKSDATKIAMLLTSMGPEGVKRFNHFSWDATTGEDKSKYDSVMAKFDSVLSGENRVVFNRYKFWDYQRSEHQTFDDYLTNLKLLAARCDFNTAENDNMIRDKIVFNTTDKRLKERLLREKDLDIKRTIEICKAAEITHNELSSMLNASHIATPSLASASKSVHVVKHKQHTQHRPMRDMVTDTSPSKRKPCRRCNNVHGSNIRKKCPAWGATCHKCKAKNHFASCCRSKTVHEVRHDADSYGTDSSDEFFIAMVRLSIGTVTRENAWFEIVEICGSKIRAKIDTGADICSVPRKTWQKMSQRPPLQKSEAVLKSFNGTNISHAGRARVTVKAGNVSTSADLFVTSGDTIPILGLRACIDLGLIRPGENADAVLNNVDSVKSEEKSLDLESMKTEFRDAFSGDGRYNGKYHITRKENSQGYIEPTHRIPFRLHQPLKIKLDELEKRGFIQKIENPTDFINNLVINEKKDGSIRLCLDPKRLNEQIMRERFEIPTFEQVAASLGGSKVFTILDQKDSYWQVELDEESAPLTTFSTPFGRYFFKRMPFGITSAAEVLQKKTFQVFGDIPHVSIIADDMLIATKTEGEHDVVLRKVLKRAIDNGVKFKLSKTQLKKSRVSYYGVSVGADGLKPDPVKIQAIVDMPDPEDKDAVKRLVGMINFLSPFIPNKSAVLNPVSKLLKQDVAWQWGTEQHNAMKTIKNVLSSEPVLALFDPEKTITIQADASSKGLGACLMQGGKPVAYASRALTKSETKYAQIEKELLAIVFAALKFHHYIYGAQVEIESDHSPLKVIFKKPLHTASPRIQAMLLKLMKYNLEVNYVPGARLHIADTLSRAYTDDNSQESRDSQLEEGQYRIHSVITDYPATPERLAELCTATASDPVLPRLSRYANDGWPSHQSSTPHDIHPYWRFRDEIHTAENGLVFAGQRLLIPVSLRNDMLTRLHEGHAGADKCKSRASQVMYWPNINADIEAKVRDCHICATYARNKPREPLLQHEMPTRPWSKVGGDILDFRGRSYLALVDYFSKYPELIRLTSITASAVIDALKPIFARHGIPDVFFSDNMPFSSARFLDFAQSWGFSVDTSSPTYPRSNGQSERTVQTTKAMLRKAIAEGKDLNLALLEYRNTPLAGTCYSPAQLLMSRRLKDTLPSTHALLQPEVAVNARTQLVNRQARQRRYYDRGTRHAKPVHIGDHVRVKLHKTWDHAVITGEHPSPRSYIVTTEDGRQYRRNTSVIKPSPDSASIVPNTSLLAQGNAPKEDSAQAEPEPHRVTVPPDKPETAGSPCEQRRSSRRRQTPPKYRDYIMI